MTTFRWLSFVFMLIAVFSPPRLSLSNEVRWRGVFAYLSGTCIGIVIGVHYFA